MATIGIGTRTESGSTAFRDLANANLLTQLAEQMALAAAPLVAVLVLGAGAGENGLLQAAQRLPFLLLTIPAGLLADRRSRSRLLWAAEGVRLVSLAAVLVLWWADWLTMPLLAIFGFLGASGTVAFSVAAPSIVTSLVPRDALAAANARIEVARSAAYVSGPVAAGVMIGWVGAGFTYGVAAGFSLGALLLLLRLPMHTAAAGAGRSPATDLREGLGFVAMHRHLRPIAITAIVFNIGFFTQQAIFVPYAHDRLGLSAGTIGVVLGMQGAGMVIGAVTAGRVMAWLRFGWVIRIGPCCGFLAAVMLLVTWWVPALPIVAVAFLVVGIGPMVWTVSSTTLRQIVTPDPMLGRVSAVITTATAGASPIGALLGAWLGSRYPLVVCLAVMVAAMAVQATVISLSAPGTLSDLHDVTERTCPTRAAAIG